MVDHKEEERRGFVRTDLSIQATLVPIGRAELNREHYLMQILPGGYDENIDASGPDSSSFTRQAGYDLVELLIQTNEKIDRIMDFLGIKEVDADSLQVIRTVNISGSGIGLVITHPLEVGQFLDISLTIPGFSMRVFRIQGEVKRISALTGKESHLYEVGVQFLNLNEDQRERLISFTFRQQRKTIRRKKNIRD